MLADLGLTAETAAQMLHVTPRTVRYWISGKVLVPYAAYRLLRILTGAELPANGWDGWHMHSGKLWTPEGHGFLPSDSSWWSLLVRQARTWKVMHDRHRALEAIMVRAGRGDVTTPAAALAADGGGMAARAPLTPVGGGGEAAPPRFIFMTLQNTQLKKGALPLEKTGLCVGPETHQNTLAPANLVGGVA
jgi:hypothetical protein